MPYVCERATLRDVPELVQLRMSYLAADFGALSQKECCSLEEELPGYLELHLDFDLLVFVMRDKPEDEDVPSPIVCCAWLLLIDKPPSPRFPHGKTGMLFNVYTAADHRRRGLARRVMEQLIAAAEELNLDVLELHATEDGYPLYQSLGFADDSTTHIAMRMMIG